MHQLRIEHRRPRGPANRIMPERDELPVEYGTRPKPPNESRHPAVALRVFAWLRPIGLGRVLNRLLRCARQFTLLRDAGVSLQSIANVSLRGLRRKFNRYGNSMPVHYR